MSDPDQFRYDTLPVALSDADATISADTTVATLIAVYRGVAYVVDVETGDRALDVLRERYPDTEVIR